MVNTQYLEQKIDDVGKSKSLLARRCGMSRVSFYNKIKGIRPFTESEATALCEELNVTSIAERKKIFLPNE